MSKLRDNPSREVPRRVLILMPLITLLIFGATFILEFNFLLVCGFFLLGTVCNLICFWLIVKGSAMVLTKREAGEKASMMPNTMLRYVIYGVVLFASLQLGLQAFVGTVIGISMVGVAIKTDGMFF